MTDMDQPDPPLPTPTRPTSPATPPEDARVCPNCGYSLKDLALPTKCTECGFQVIELHPPWTRRPTGWRRRLWLVGWTVPTYFVGIGLALMFAIGASGIGIGIFGLCCGAVLINMLVGIFGVAFMPPQYDDSETPQQRRRRRILTMFVTMGLSLAVPVLLLGSCAVVAYSMGSHGNFR